MKGVEFLESAIEIAPRAIRMMLTGYADIGSLARAVNEGRIYRYITKPWEPDELRAVLHQACEEYEQCVERKRLLTDLRSHVAQGLGLVQGLREGTYGTLPPAEQTVVEQFTAAGSAFLERLDRVLAPGQSQALG